MRKKDDEKIIDFAKAKEIPNYGIAGKVGNLKGDMSGCPVLVVQDFLDGTIAILRMHDDGRLDSIPKIPEICIAFKK